LSRIARPNGDDHPAAAAKHLTDWRTLQHQNRYDGAAYLSGYVIECCVKALILVEGRPPWGHDLRLLGGDALRLAAVPGARTARYAPWHNAGHVVYHNTTGWHPDLRYRPEGTLAAALVQQWIDEAEYVYSRTIVPMTLDGVV
jgi:hypothetical protein